MTPSPSKDTVAATTHGAPGNPATTIQDAINAAFVARSRDELLRLELRHPQDRVQGRERPFTEPSGRARVGVNLPSTPCLAPT